jgi:hypothetical protein
MPVSLVKHGRFGALVSDLPPGRPLGNRGDLVAHERVLARLAEEYPVLPFRFGAAMTGPEKVASELLAANQDRLLDDLERIAGRVELVVKGRYEDEVVYREVLDEAPEVREIHERIQGKPEAAVYNERVRMGELVAQVLARKQAVDGERLVSALSPYAEEVLTRGLAQEDEVVNAAFLVKRDRRARFERALEELGQEWAGRIRLRMVGPVAPYDFVSSPAGREAA